MPAVRNARRSRRLLNRPPADPEYETLDEDVQAIPLDGLNIYDDSPRTPELTYDTASSSPSISTPEISPPSSPQSDDSDFAPPRSSTSTHGRKKKEGHIPRPSNAFIIFRSEMWKHDMGDEGVEKDHRQISRIAGIRWKKLDEKTKAQYQRKAKLAKEKHEQMYPGYKYAPTGKRKVKRRKTKANRDQEVAKAQMISDLIAQGYRQEDLTKALNDVEQQGMLKHQQAVASVASRSTRTAKVPARSSRFQPIAPRTREQPRRGSTHTPSVTVHPPSALGLEFSPSHSPDTQPEFVPPCSTVDEAVMPSIYAPWPSQLGSDESLLDPPMGDLGVLGLSSFGTAVPDYDPTFGNMFVAGCAPDPLCTPLQQFSPLNNMTSPLAPYTSIDAMASPLHVQSSPMLGVSMFGNGPGPSMSSPYNTPSSLMSSPEASLSPLSGTSLSSPDASYLSPGYSSPASSVDHIETLGESLSPPDTLFDEWIQDPSTPTSPSFSHHRL